MGISRYSIAIFGLAFILNSPILAKALPALDCAQTKHDVLTDLIPLKIRTNAKPQSRWKTSSWEDLSDAEVLKHFESISDKPIDPPYLEWEGFGRPSDYFKQYFRDNEETQKGLAFEGEFYKAISSRLTPEFKKDSQASISQYINLIQKKKLAGVQFTPTELAQITTETMNQMFGWLMANEIHFDVHGARSGKMIFSFRSDGPAQINRITRHLLRTYDNFSSLIYSPEDAMGGAARWDQSGRIYLDTQALDNLRSTWKIIHEATHALTDLHHSSPNLPLSPFPAIVNKVTERAIKAKWLGPYEGGYRLDEMTAFERQFKGQFSDILNNLKKGQIPTLNPDKKEFAFEGLLDYLRTSSSVTEQSAELADAMLRDLALGKLRHKFADNVLSVDGVSAIIEVKAGRNDYEILLPVSKGHDIEAPNLQGALEKQVRSLKEITDRYTVFNQYLQIIYDQMIKTPKGKTIRTQDTLQRLLKSWYAPNKGGPAPNLKDLISRFNAVSS